MAAISGGDGRGATDALRDIRDAEQKLVRDPIGEANALACTLAYLKPGLSREVRLAALHSGRRVFVAAAATAATARGYEVLKLEIGSRIVAR